MSDQLPNGSLGPDGWAEPGPQPATTPIVSFDPDRWPPPATLVPALAPPRRLASGPGLVVVSLLSVLCFRIPARLGTPVSVFGGNPGAEARPSGIGRSTASA